MYNHTINRSIEVDMKRNRLLFVILALLLTACQQVTVEPTAVVTDAPTPVTPTNTRTLRPSKTFSPTSTATPLFWEEYPVGTPVPIQTMQPETSRQDYRTNLENFTQFPETDSDYYENFLLEFLDAYEYAVTQELAWIKDPLFVALRITGHPNPDRIYPDEISVYQIDEEHLIISLFRFRAHDDSVRDVEDRVELAKEDDHWRAEWYGSRWRCQPNRGHQDWGTDLCN